MRFSVKTVTLATALIVGVCVTATQPVDVSAAKQPNSQSEARKPTKKKPAKKVVVTVEPGDNLSDIASAHKTTWVRLFNANETISDPNLLNAGDKVRIPDASETLPDRYGQLMSQQAPVVAPAPQTTTVTKSYSTAPVNASSYYVGNGMWCTDYVQSKRPDVPVYGNAGYNWISSAQTDGKSTGSAPRKGAVAVTNGHVAYVESVNADGSYTVSEMGWNYQAGSYNKRTVQPGAFGQFIY